MAISSLLDAIPRSLMAFFFIASGAGKVFAFQQSSTIMASVGFSHPIFFLIGIIILEIGGGLSLLLRFETKFVSIILIMFLILATIVFHARFICDPVSGPDQFVQVIKNIAIIAGLITFVEDRGGLFSRDNRLRRAEVKIIP